MERLGHHTLARAVLSGDEHVGFGRSDASDDLQHRLHRPRLADQERPGFAPQQEVLLFELSPLSQRPAQFDLRPQDCQKALVLPRLGDEIAGPATHGLHRQLDAAPGGHDHDGQGAVDLLDLEQKVKALLSRGAAANVVQVQQRDVEVMLGHSAKNLRRRAGRLDPVALGLQQQTQRPQHIGLVVTNQNPRTAISRIAHDAAL